MKTKIKSIAIAVLLGLFLIAPALALAQINPISPTVSESSNTKTKPSLITTLENVGKAGGYQTDSNIASTPRIVGVVIGAFVGFLGLTFLVLMIIAGYGWMTANGNEEQISKSKKTIKNAIIGLIVAASAWSIWNFIFQKFILLQ